MIKPVSLIKALIALVLLSTIGGKAYAQDAVSDSADQVQALIAYYDSLNSTIHFQEGTIDVNDAVQLTIPQGYKFIDRQNARMIVEDIWENPEDDQILGMVVRDSFHILSFDEWAFIVTYEESGYVKDKDADDIDYDEMLKNIQDGEEEVNKQRIAAGYPSIHLLDWASKPYYDKDRKILHWAKKLKFGTEAETDDQLTLNYDIRFLGRKGVLSMNAVGVMGQLTDIKDHIPDVLNTVAFKDGYAYKDFNPSVDKVAAYTVGGLIAGKLLAKAGLFALILKNIKLVVLAIAGLFGAFRKKIARLFKGKKEQEDEYAYATVPDGEQPTQGASAEDNVEEEPKS